MIAPLTDPRDVAVLAMRDREGHVTAHLEGLLRRAELSGPDAGLARELALGTARRCRTLDAVLRAFLKRPDRRPPGVIREILRVGLYQVLLLDRVPDHAAVSEAVEQAGRFHHRRQGGLVNGVLRSVARSLSAPGEGPGSVAADAVCVDATAHRTFDRPVFPDPASEPVAWLADAHSLPEMLASRWLGRMGEMGQAVAVAAHCNTRAPVILRVNTLKASVEDVLAELAAAGLDARPHANGRSVVLDSRGDVTALDAFRRGAVQVQDASATAVVDAAGAAPGMNVLDLCAAPGTKTTHLGEAMGNDGSIVAADVSAEKLARVEDNCSRMGVGIVRTVAAEAVGGLETGSFDLVLADVPCTNTGVLSRRPEARWRFDDKALARAVADQKFLARTAVNFVRPGGRLVYSTCSIEPEECGQVVRWLCKQAGRLNLREERLTLPGGAADGTRWHDGGYYAVLEAD